MQSAAAFEEIRRSDPSINETHLLPEHRRLLKFANAYIACHGLTHAAIMGLSRALRKGMHHSRQDLQDLHDRLHKELNQVTTDYDDTLHINSNVRLFDLVRYMRRELHEAGLITDEEYYWLCSSAPLARNPDLNGSPSRRRLEDYDDLRKQLTTLQQEHEELLRRVSPHP
jgi:hypothetical protein